MTTIRQTTDKTRGPQPVPVPPLGYRDALEGEVFSLSIGFRVPIIVIVAGRNPI